MTPEAAWLNPGDSVGSNDVGGTGRTSFDAIGLMSQSKQLLGSSVNSDADTFLPNCKIDGLEPNQTDGEAPVEGVAAQVNEQAPAPAPVQEKPTETFDANGIPIQRIDHGRNMTAIITDFDTAGSIARVTSLKQNNTIEVRDYSPNQSVTTIYDFGNNRISGTIINADGSTTPFNFVPPAGQAIPRPPAYVRR